jgi:hypothetical protein
MKHGDKAKAKSAKAKASGKKSSSKSGTKNKAVSAKSKKPGSVKSAPKKAAPQPKTSNDNGKGRPRGIEGIHFTNPVVASAFRRAVKKYPAAFRRLTD